MGYETENSLASIEKALDMDVDMIEIDVFKIKSGEIVVFHDQTVDQLTNGAGNVEDYDYESLQELSLKGGHKIPLLQDVLKLIDAKCELNIELKGANTADRVNYITQYYIKEQGWTQEQFLISSFNWDELKEMRTYNPEVDIAVLVEDNDPLKALPIAKELNAVAINPDFETLTKANVKKIHEEGYKVYTWTVNEEEDIKKAKRLPVDGIFSNYPDKIK